MASKLRAREILAQHGYADTPAEWSPQRSPPRAAGESWDDGGPAQQSICRPTVRWLELPNEAPVLQGEYSPQTISVICKSASVDKSALSNTAAILKEVLGEDDGEIVVEDDSDWTKYPEVRRAIKRSGGEEYSYCVARLPSYCLWGVGVAGRYKVRESAAKLALAIMLAEHVEEFSVVAGNYPEYRSLCSEAGFMNGPGVENAPKRPRLLGDSPPEDGVLQVPKKSGQAIDESNSKAVHRDVPIWLRMSSGLGPAFMEDGSPEALAVATDGARLKALYTKADDILERVLRGIDNPKVSYHSDEGWTSFPEIGEELKALASIEECLVVAVCEALRLWAVGVGPKYKQRYGAAKIALAATLVLHTEDEGNTVDLSDFPSFEDFVDNARLKRR